MQILIIIETDAQKQTEKKYMRCQHCFLLVTEMLAGFLFLFFYFKHYPSISYGKFKDK